MNVDVVFPVTIKSIYMLMQNMDLILENIPVKNVVLIGNEQTLKIACENIEIKNIRYINEDKLIDGLTLKNIKRLIKERIDTDRRAGWYFQQFLKMAYALICEDAYYLIWDSDTIPVRYIDLFDSNGKPYMAYVSQSKYEADYYVTMKNLLGLTKSDSVSYVTEHMLFNCDVMRELIYSIENNPSLKGCTFYEKIINTIEINALNLSGFSEFETYAEYLLSKYKSMYALRKWHNLRHGRIYFGSQPSHEVLLWVGKDYMTMSIEHFDMYWPIFRFVSSNKFMKNHSFESVTKISEPIIAAYFDVRMSVRKIAKTKQSRTGNKKC